MLLPLNLNLTGLVIVEIKHAADGCALDSEYESDGTADFSLIDLTMFWAPR